MDAPVTDAQAAHRAYLAELARVDMRVVDGVRRDPQRVQRVLRSLARNISTGAEITTIAKDTSLPPDGAAVGRLTVDDYLDAFARLMITEDLGAWMPSLRSRARLRTRPVRHLADPCPSRSPHCVRPPRRCWPTGTTQACYSRTWPCATSASTSTPPAERPTTTATATA